MVKYELYNVDEFEPVRATYAWQHGMSYSNVWQNKADITDVTFVDAAGEVRTRPAAKLDNLRRLLIHEERACDLKRVFVGSFEEAATGTDMVPVLFIDSFDDAKIYSSEDYIFSTRCIFVKRALCCRARSECTEAAPSLCRLP